MLRRLLLFMILFCAWSNAHAQEISFKDTVADYNHLRLHTNKTGMEVLGSWGIANMIAGGIGYSTAKQDEWKRFHEMNFIWGAVNTGIAVSGLINVRKEMQKKWNADQAYDRYKTTKKLYLVNIGLDLIYVGTGVVLAEVGNENKNGATLTGFGKSIAMQGVFLLLFDNVMYATQQRNNSNWFRIMNEIHVSGTGVGINHTFK